MKIGMGGVAPGRDQTKSPPRNHQYQPCNLSGKRIAIDNDAIEGVKRSGKRVDRVQDASDGSAAQAGSHDQRTCGQRSTIKPRCSG
ncbi:hypothetical protein TRIP_B40232 [uncultured Desulfatiglans sp.]|uniref:Uncharacterized protein n=1 Tax=Uncultured Desulfatiglans sp. TaxID=1748965 RepID=A0A653AE87_UNCDX|nr:hypothetical protein TRIP_B40232 [uncultured Desulfatiglans sp.]